MLFVKAAAAAAASTLSGAANSHAGQGSQSEYNGQSQLGQSGSHRSGTPGPGVSLAKMYLLNY